MATKYSGSETTKAFAGEVAQGSDAGGSEHNENARHVCEPVICMNLGKVGAGANSEYVLLMRAHADLTVTKAAIVAGEAHTASANSPSLGLSKSSTAAGSLTALGTPIDGTAETYTAREEVAMTLASTAISAGDYVFAVINKNGTPANTTGPMSILVEYELAN